MRNVLILITIIGIVSLLTMVCKRIDDKIEKKMRLNRDNPIRTEPIAKMADKYPELYINRFIDTETKTVCYTYKGSISCVR